MKTEVEVEPKKFQTKHIHIWIDNQEEWDALLSLTAREQVIPNNLVKEGWITAERGVKLTKLMTELHEELYKAQ